MAARLLNWKTLLVLLALLMVGASLIYTRYLSRKIAAEERQRVAEWIAATKALQQSADVASIELSNLVIRNNEDMPLIATDSSGNIIDYHNIDTALMAANPNYLQERLEQISDENLPLEWVLNTDPKTTYFVYYGHTLLQREVKYYPIVQLVLVALFIALLIALITTQNRSAKTRYGRVWPKKRPISWAPR
jgi:cell division protein FtsL